MFIADIDFKLIIGTSSNPPCVRQKLIRSNRKLANKINYAIQPNKYISSSGSLVSIVAAIKIRVRHIRSETAIKCVNVHELLKVVERNKYRPLPFPDRKIQIEIMGAILNLLECAGKILRSSQLMTQLHCNRWLDITDCLGFFIP